MITEQARFFGEALLNSGYKLFVLAGVDSAGQLQITVAGNGDHTDLDEIEAALFDLIQQLRSRLEFQELMGSA